MMTQMVMSRGVPHSLPDTPPSLRYAKGHFLSDNEDVMVMDTKLKIIEILQVGLYNLYMNLQCCRFFFLLTHLTLFPVHLKCEVGLQDHLLIVHLQERIWRQEHNRQLFLT